MIYSTNLNCGQYERTIYSILNFLGDVGGLYSVVMAFGFYLSLFVQQNYLKYFLIAKVYKIEFKFELKDAFSCNKTKRRIKIDRGLKKID